MSRASGNIPKLPRRVPMIVANWKMHKTAPESVKAARQIKRLLKGIRGGEICIAPSFTAIDAVGKEVSGSNLRLAAQNVHWAAEGGFTGEISPVQLKRLGCRAVIIGHSERRHVFGETPAIIRKRVEGAVAHGLKVIFCIGETLGERRSGATAKVLRKQLDAGLSGIKKDDIKRIAVAYEPVWAIGTGHSASSQQVRKAHLLIRRNLIRWFGLLRG
ncbi:MAG TPA: triose-phosphate isomerase, partial [Nitrospiria bacterium]|nr:triose-phosphate isomerase [Nitrospiria bacterium]